LFGNKMPISLVWTSGFGQRIEGLGLGFVDWGLEFRVGVWGVGFAS